MAVIITNMNMPQNCNKCGCHNECGCCDFGDDIHVDYKSSKRPLDCPLKSADKIIAEINNLTAPKTDTEYQDGFYDCEQMILNIINKYCKGET